MDDKKILVLSCVLASLLFIGNVYGFVRWFFAI